MTALKRIRTVQFDEMTHSYWAGERELIGVTSLMKKHGLSADYSGISKDVLEHAAALGTAIHKTLEDYDNGLPYIPDNATKSYAKLAKRHIASEYLVSDGGKTVASFIDKVYEGDEPGTVELCDIKSTIKIHKRALQWQLGIYKYLFEKQNPGLKVYKCSVMQFDKNTRELKAYEDVIPVTPEEVKALLEAERKGEPYADDRQQAPEIGLVLQDSELDEYVSITRKIADIRAALDAFKKKADEMDAAILDYMEKNNIDEMTSPFGVFKKKKAYIRTSFDSARFKNDDPETFGKYTKTVMVAPSLTFKSNT